MPLGRIQPVEKLFSSHEKKSKVRKCLFGPSDSDSIRKDLDEILQQEKMKAEVKWNFDLEEESPLEGRYEWDVCEDDSVPDFYKRDVHRPVKKHHSRIHLLNRDHSSFSNSSVENVRSLDFKKQDSDSSSDSEGHSRIVRPNLNLKQSRLSGYFQQTKRKAGKLESSRSVKAIRF